MRLSILLIALAAVTGARSQISVTPDFQFKCPPSGGQFCAGDTGVSNIILRCQANGFAQPGNCDDNLAGVTPVGVKVNALCVQSTDTAGDAQCVLVDNNLIITYSIPATVNPTPRITTINFVTRTTDACPAAFPTATSAGNGTVLAGRGIRGRQAITTGGFPSGLCADDFTASALSLLGATPTSYHPAATGSRGNAKVATSASGLVAPAAFTGAAAKLDRHVGVLLAAALAGLCLY